MRCWNRNVALILTFAGCLMFGLTSAHASKAVTLKVAVVHATKTKETKKDPALKKIRRSLKKAFGKIGYTSFRQVQKQTLELAVGQSGVIKLPAAQKALVKYTGKKAKRHMVKLSIPKSKVNVALRAPARKIFYQAGIPYKDGILILAFYLKEAK